MRSSMSCHSCPGHRALYVSTTSSVFTCTLIEATVTPASCQHHDVYAPTGFNEVFPALSRPATRTPIKSSSSSTTRKTSRILWPSLLRDSNKTHSPPQFFTLVHRILEGIIV